MGPFPHFESPIPKITTLMTEVEVDLIVIQVLVSHSVAWLSRCYESRLFLSVCTCSWRSEILRAGEHEV